MTERTFTAVEMRELDIALALIQETVNLSGWQGYFDAVVKARAMLRQAANADARWAELKAWHQAQDAHANQMKAKAPIDSHDQSVWIWESSAHQRFIAEMARIEGARA